MRVWVLCPQALSLSLRNLGEPSMPRILSGVGLAGGGAVTQFLGGFPALPREGGSCLDPKEALGRGGGDMRRRSKT